MAYPPYQLAIELFFGNLLLYYYSHMCSTLHRLRDRNNRLNHHNEPKNNYHGYQYILLPHHPHIYNSLFLQNILGQRQTQIYFRKNPYKYHQQF